MSAHDMKTLLEFVEQYGAQHYPLYPIIFREGKGVWVRDADGREYMDACSGYSANNLGHANQEIDKVIRKALIPSISGWALVNIVPNSTPVAPYATFLEHFCTVLGYDKALATNGGVEGVETAIKLMRKWGYTKKSPRVEKDHAQIIVCGGNFHGRTTTVVGFSSNASYRDLFGPKTPGFISIPFGDAAALEGALILEPNVVGFLVEPIQGENGVRIPPAGYLKACAELCKKYHVVFCADEIQTGLGRTGTLLACEHEGVTPDIFILGKSLGGGRVPTAAVFAKSEFMVFEPGDHGSTYGGNALAMTIAQQVLTIVIRDQLCARSTEMGSYLLEKLQHGLSRKPAGKLVQEVRGRGLMIGIELAADVQASEVINALLERGVMTKDAHGVIRITPPLIITKEECDELALRIGRAFRDVARKEKVCSCGHACPCGKNKSCE